MSRTGWTIATVGGVLLLVMAGFEAATWRHREPAGSPERTGSGATRIDPRARPEDKLPAPAGPFDATAPGEEADGLPTQVITLYFLRPDGQALSPEPVEIFVTAALLDRLKQTVTALIRGPAPGSGLAPALPAGTPLRDVYLDSAGTLYVDFGQELVSRLPAGSASEVLAAGSLANTLILNFSEVHRVRVLVMGEEITSLSGHMDLSRPLSAEPRLIVPWSRPEDAGSEDDRKEAWELL